MKSDTNEESEPAAEQDEIIFVTLDETATAKRTPIKPRRTHFVKPKKQEARATTRYILSGKRWIVFWVIVALIVFQLFFGILGSRIPYFIRLFSARPIFPFHVDNHVLTTMAQIHSERVWQLAFLKGTASVFSIGAVLALAGSSFQSLFKNPLASPDVLGVTAGGSLGGGIYIIATLNAAGNTIQSHGLQIGPLQFPLGMMQVVMLFSGLAVVLLVVLISTYINRQFRSTTTLMLTGMAISAVCTSILSYIKADLLPTDDTDNRITQLSVLMYGNLGNNAPLTIAIMGAVFTPILFLLGSRLDAMTFGEEEAKGLGIQTGLVRMSVIVCATFLVISVVSTVGPVSWVGMVAPFVARMLVGPDNKKLMPVSMVLGSLLVAVVEQVASFHLPVIRFFGPMTSITVASVILFFVFLVWSKKKGGSAWM
ncbi:FecCD family ABC transporter permease [Ethanoligenens sp.]|uniref:FecCD family ABC transporter permease n=1 Tax=Ethanoligenens sp. TaxID=2099655 RepID=UPI0039E9822A